MKIQLTFQYRRHCDHNTCSEKYNYNISVICLEIVVHCIKQNRNDFWLHMKFVIIFIGFIDRYKFLANFKCIQRMDVLLRALNSRRHHCEFYYQLTKHLAVSASCVLELSCGLYMLIRRMRRIIREECYQGFTCLKCSFFKQTTKK